MGCWADWYHFWPGGVPSEAQWAPGGPPTVPHAACCLGRLMGGFGLNGGRGIVVGSAY